MLLITFWKSKSVILTLIFYLHIPSLLRNYTHFHYVITYVWEVHIYIILKVIPHFHIPSIFRNFTHFQYAITYFLRVQIFQFKSNSSLSHSLTFLGMLPTFNMLSLTCWESISIIWTLIPRFHIPSFFRNYTHIHRVIFTFKVPDLLFLSQPLTFIFTPFYIPSLSYSTTFIVPYSSYHSGFIFRYLLNPWINLDNRFYAYIISKLTTKRLTLHNNYWFVQHPSLWENNPSDIQYTRYPRFGR